MANVSFCERVFGCPNTQPEQDSFARIGMSLLPIVGTCMIYANVVKGQQVWSSNPTYMNVKIKKYMQLGCISSITTAALAAFAYFAVSTQVVLPLMALSIFTLAFSLILRNPHMRP